VRFRLSSITQTNNVYLGCRIAVFENAAANQQTQLLHYFIQVLAYLYNDLVHLPKLYLLITHKVSVTATTHSV